MARTHLVGISCLPTSLLSLRTCVLSNTAGARIAAGKRIVLNVNAAGSANLLRNTRMVPSGSRAVRRALLNNKDTNTFSPLPTL